MATSNRHAAPRPPAAAEVAAKAEEIVRWDRQLGSLEGKRDELVQRRQVRDQLVEPTDAFVKPADYVMRTLGAPPDDSSARKLWDEAAGGHRGLPRPVERRRQHLARAATGGSRTAGRSRSGCGHAARAQKPARRTHDQDEPGHRHDARPRVRRPRPFRDGTLSRTHVTPTRPAQRVAHPERLPLQPLLDALPIDHQRARPDVAAPGVVAQAAELLAVSTRTVHRLRASGLTPWTADRLAVAAGFHPLAVWGDAWIRAVGSGPVPKEELANGLRP